LRRSRFEMAAAAPSPRDASRRLAGYLCGTHSGVLALGSAGTRLSANRGALVAAAHRNVASSGPPGDEHEIGKLVWEPDEQQQLLDRSLCRALAHPAVIDLVFYGSQANGGRTGFSDVDAILVIADAAAGDAEQLHSLRPHVLAAQRAVVAYQPMQHHGFEVATPKLLREGGDALALPPAALAEARSLHGTGATARLADGAERSTLSFGAVVRTLTTLERWPPHPWKAHGFVSMFDLLPTLYLQSRGANVPKRQSFEEARPEFGRAWWPYDELRDVRAAWPRQRLRRLEHACALARNPWLALAAWRRLPEPLPQPIRPLLTRRLLEGLQMLAVRMLERTA
jgi:hypothetical protein